MKKIFNVKEHKIKKSLETILVTMLMLSSKVYAVDVVSEVSGGGEIQSSKLGQGLLNMVKDVTGTMQWILPIVRSLFYIILCI